MDPDPDVDPDPCKTVEIKVFHTILPGGLKTCGSGFGFGSATLSPGVRKQWDPDPGPNYGSDTNPIRIRIFKKYLDPYYFNQIFKEIVEEKFIILKIFTTYYIPVAIFRVDNKNPAKKL
jgi:hypothetical protein